jgi:glycosyltransferase involved in cell wall biosynthesis
MPKTALTGPYGQTKPRVAIVSFPFKGYSPYKFLSELLLILTPISDRIIILDGNTDRIQAAPSSKIVMRDIGVSMHYLRDLKPKYFSAVVWILKWLLIQCRVSLELTRARADLDIVLFYLAYPGYLLPLIVTKLHGKKSIEVLTRSKATTKTDRLWALQDPILFTLLDGISPESRGLIKELGIDKYGHKILPEGARFVDSRHYAKQKRLSERANVVGFIGRLAREKGIVEFVRAIPLAAKESSDLKFLIVGSGPLSAWVTEQCNHLSAEFGTDIKLLHWVDETDLPSFYNELKLFVLPSYRDALPTSILEAMACGTPVLAAPVGAITDVIIDECTGFLLESIAPEHIAQRIIATLNSSELEKIADRAESLIRQRFTRTAAIERYDEMFQEVLLDVRRPTI